MKIVQRAGVFFLVVASLSNSVFPSERKAPSATELRKSMARLNEVLEKLLPEVLSEERYNSPKNFKKIEQSALELSLLARQLKNHAPAVDPDLSVPLISRIFETETQRAYDELKRGHRGYARSILKSVPGFCIGCHTRSGGADRMTKWTKESLDSFASRIERAEFLAATRQFDKSLDEFEAIIADPAIATGKQVEWERAVRYGLSVAIRVKADPVRALAIVDRLIASPVAPSFLKEDASAWRESILKWKGEPKREAVTAEGMYSEASRLMSTARAEQKYPADRSADVDYLRASAVLHELLRKFPDGPKTPEALFLLGVSYEVLRDLNLWSLHELFYLSCIQKAPHTQVAESCYRRFEAATYAGYSGSGGVSLPEDVRQQLQEFRTLADPVVQKSP